MKATRCFKALCAALVICMVISFCGFTGACEDIADRVLRLHIVAASDDERDQALKLKVRDAVLGETAGLFDGVYSTELAYQRLQEALPEVQQAAEYCLLQNGCDDTVNVELCRMHFTTRHYDTGTLPAGMYEALRVTIGEGKGHNWWCVVFPPMCVGSAGETTDDVLTAKEESIVTQPSSYRVQLKVVEWYHHIREWLT